MADILAAAETIDWAVKIVTLILLIVASSLVIKKKNNIALAFVIVGNLSVYYFTRSPLLCMIISIAGIIWASMAKRGEQKGEVAAKSTLKQPLKSSAPIHSEESGKRMVKPGQIIGLILGILMMGGPIVGFMIGEASLSDSKGKMIGIGFIIFGAFMLIVNIIGMVMGTDNLLAAAKPAGENKPAPSVASEAKTEEKENMVRCRFCKKKYSSEYNGCPYCKKK